MTYDEIIVIVAEKLGLSKTMVNKIYQAYWQGVRDHIKDLPLKEDLTDEQFNNLRPNVNVPSIGKFYITSDRYHRIKKQTEYLNSLKNNKE